MDSSEPFLAARDLIREHGWTRMVDENSQGRLCVRGALRKAVTGSAWITPIGRRKLEQAFHLLQRHITRQYGEGITVTVLNDGVFTHEDEACAFLEDVAKHAANKGGVEHGAE